MGNTLNDGEKPYLRLAGMIAGNLGAMSPEVVGYYVKQADQIPCALLRGFVFPPPNLEFALLVDLGIIKVPYDYVHERWLSTFLKQDSWGRNRKFHCYHGWITDEKFSNPSRILRPGERFRVRVFNQIIGGTTTSDERLGFLDTQKAIYTGAQGASLVFEQKRNQLPKGKWYTSFDGKGHPQVEEVCPYGVPRLDCHTNGGYCFSLQLYKGEFTDKTAFLCFTEVGDEVA